MAMVNDLWRECAAWLTRCKIIPPDHKANWKDSKIKVLALTLRDGVLLCNLIAFLDSDDTRVFNRKPQMAQFLCCHNIKLFLETCKTQFGLRDSDLFEASMLYDLTNFHQVLITLSKLSQCRKVQQSHPDIPGFNILPSSSEGKHSDETIYKDLHSTESGIESETVDEDTPPQGGSISLDDENSDLIIDIGDNVDDVTTLNEDNVEKNNNSNEKENSENSLLSGCDIDTSSDYLSYIYYEEDDKIYENLCYVTISNQLPEVLMIYLYLL